jgi:hypothetical protein
MEAVFIEARRPPVGLRSPGTLPRRASGFLAMLLLVVLSGILQVGVSLTDHELGGEHLRPVPLTRSLLLDKLLPQAFTVAPPVDSHFPPLLTTPAAPLSLPARGRQGRAEERRKPGLWLTGMMLVLYRQHSSYV